MGHILAPPKSLIPARQYYSVKNRGMNGRETRCSRYVY